MGIGSNAAIVSIGAVRFDKEVIETFYQTISLESCASIGMDIDANAVVWWLKQACRPRLEIALADSEIRETLWNLSNWMIKDFPGGPSEVWGNGSDFDNVILENAFDRIGVEAPWKFYNNRCFRTMKNQFPVEPPAREGDLHNALDDAIHQAKHLIEIEHIYGIRNYTKESE
jgi:exodeoxyribonuclease VIII